MRCPLIPHPDFPAAAVSRIVIELQRGDSGILALRYLVSGDIAKLLLPQAATAIRADNLWQHTCFEAFVRPANKQEYYEFNFAPSNAWAAYHFAGYRERMSAAGEVRAPVFDTCCTAEEYELGIGLSFPPPHTIPGPDWLLGISAVIEETNGHKSYWALAHPPGKPDFHHPDCFRLVLPAALSP